MGVFPLSPHRNVYSLSHTTSAAITWARLRPRSSLAQACSGPLTLFTSCAAAKTYLTRNYQLLIKGPKRPLFQPGIPNMSSLYTHNYTKRYENDDSSFIDASYAVGGFHVMLCIPQAYWHVLCRNVVWFLVTPESACSLMICLNAWV
jgi:hypothetical protein